jgi:uncharacterized protein
MTDSMRFSTQILLTLLLLILSAEVSKAQIYPARPVGYVNDFARFMSATESNRLEAKLQAYRDSTSNVIVIATLADLGGESIEKVAQDLFSAWGMWEGERQNGVLILATRAEREVRIEVGYGLEGAIPDIMAGRIVREVIIPGFQQGQFYTAFDRSSDIVMQLAAGEYEALARNIQSGDEVHPAALLILLFIFIAVLILSRKMRGPGGGHHIGRGGVIVMGPGYRRGGYNGGFGGGFGGGGMSRGGGFGGFGGGGGFGSGGGGASGRW